MPSWTAAPHHLSLCSYQVDVWRACLDLPDACLQMLETYLSEDELQRANRFYFQADRNHFIAAHACLRDVLARYLHMEAGQLSFASEPQGKPIIAGSPHDQQVTFNLSHSHSLALVAVACERRVGVDLERIRHDISTQDIARRFFSPREVADLLTLPSELQVQAFFNCWTRKEAYIKAQGLGLSLPLDSFDVSLTPGEPAGLRATHQDPQGAARWTLQHLEVAQDYAAALAVEGQGLEIRLWDWKV